MHLRVKMHLCPTEAELCVPLRPRDVLDDLWTDQGNEEPVTGVKGLNQQH